MSASEIAIIIEYQVSAQDRAVFLQALRENCAATLKDDGCLRMEVSLPDGGDGRIVWLSERWRDQAAIDKHRKQPGHDAQHERIDRLIETKRVVRGSVVFG
jgi:(4S)-4-hydroxy-5-phosphonooxypentane-2,3-dione isomerase